MYNLIDLAVWGRRSKTYTRLTGSNRHYTRKQPRTRIVLNERAMTRLTGKLLTELDRDTALSIVNEIKRCAA